MEANNTALQNKKKNFKLISVLGRNVQGDLKMAQIGRNKLAKLREVIKKNSPLTVSKCENIGPPL